MSQKIYRYTPSKWPENDLPEHSRMCDDCRTATATLMIYQPLTAYCKACCYTAHGAEESGEWIGEPKKGGKHHKHHTKGRKVSLRKWTAEQDKILVDTFMGYLPGSWLSDVAISLNRTENAILWRLVTHHEIAVVTDGMLVRIRPTDEAPGFEMDTLTTVAADPKLEESYRLEHEDS